MSRRSPKRAALLQATQFAKKHKGRIVDGPEGSVCRVVALDQPRVCCVSCGVKYGSPIAELPMNYFHEDVCGVCKAPGLTTPPLFFGELSPLWKVHKPGTPTVAKLIEALSDDGDA